MRANRDRLRQETISGSKPYSSGNVKRIGAPMKSRATWLAGCALVVLLGAGKSCAQEGVAPGALPVTAVTSKITIPDAAQPSAHFDVEAAADAYMEEIPASG